MLALKRWVFCTTAALSVAQPVSATAAMVTAKGCGDVGVAAVEKLITKPLFLTTLFLVNPSDQRIPIPINRQTIGQASAAAHAMNFFSSDSDADPGTGGGNNPAKPNERTGPVLTPGTPPITGSVATRMVTAAVTGANSDAQASVSGGIVGGEQPGDILGAIATTNTDCHANAFFGIASSAAKAGTDPFVLAPLAVPTNARLDIDLVGNLATDPNAGFGFAAFASDGFAASSFSLRAVTNIPSLPTLFTLAFNLNSGADSVDVDFVSSQLTQPIFASDFTPLDFAPGHYLLDPAKRTFSVPFVIPAGALGSDSLGPFGFALDIFAEGSAFAAAPEPSTFALFILAALILVWRHPAAASFARGARKFR